MAGRAGRAAPLVAVAALAAVVLLASGCGGSQAAGREMRNAAGGRCRQRLAAAGVRGRFAFVRNGGISILDLPSCRTHVLLARSDAKGPLRFSADGRYLAYGDGQVVEAEGAPVPRRPLGELSSWAWSPRGDELAGVSGGGLEIWRPGGRARRLLPAGWGATRVAFSPDGVTLAVTRSVPESHGVAREDELWSLRPASGRRRLLYRAAGIGQLGSGIAGFTPDGRDVLLWPDLTGSASLAEDGLPLAAVPAAGGRPRTLVAQMLAYPDYVAACGGGLVVAAGSDRYATSGKRLVRLAPPFFGPVPLHLSRARSWTAPSCSRSGEIVAAASASRIEAHFGLEHRSIWLIPAAGGRPRRLAAPSGRQVSDELPRIASSGRYVLYIATASPPGGGLTAGGSLWAVPTGRAHTGPIRPIGPIAQLGEAGNYYGHYGWAQVTAWHERGGAESASRR